MTCCPGTQLLDLIPLLQLSPTELTHCHCLEPVLLAPKALYSNSKVPDNQICSKESLIKLSFIDPLVGKNKENNKWWLLILSRNLYQFPCPFCSERKKSHNWIYRSDNAYNIFCGKSLSKSYPVFCLILQPKHQISLAYEVVVAITINQKWPECLCLWSWCSNYLKSREYRYA